MNPLLDLQHFVIQLDIEADLAEKQLKESGIINSEKSAILSGQRDICQQVLRKIKYLLEKETF